MIYVYLPFWVYVCDLEEDYLGTISSADSFLVNVIFYYNDRELSPFDFIGIGNYINT